jgi:hypothetical protein
MSIRNEFTRVSLLGALKMTIKEMSGHGIGGVLVFRGVDGKGRGVLRFLVVGNKFLYSSTRIITRGSPEQEPLIK